MTGNEAVAMIRQAKLVHCTKMEYEQEIRGALQDAAGKWLDQGQDPYAIITLQEVRRLDGIHRFNEPAEEGKP